MRRFVHPFLLFPFFLFFVDSCQQESSDLEPANQDYYQEVYSADDGHQVAIIGTVQIMTGSGFLVYNGKDAIFVFTQNTPRCSIGDKVKVIGRKQTERNMAFISDDGLSVKVLSSDQNPYPVSYTIVTDSFDKDWGNTSIPVEVEGVLYESEGRYCISIDGAQMKCVLYNPASSFALDGLIGQYLNIKGFYGGMSGADKYIYVSETSVIDLDKEPVLYWLSMPQEDDRCSAMITDGKDYILYSKNGEFGAIADTLLFISVKNNEKALLITDNNGIPTMISDSNVLYEFEIDEEENTINVLQFSDNQFVNVGHTQYQPNFISSPTKASLPASAILNDFLNSMSFIMDLSIGCAFDLMNSVESISNNPNFRVIEITANSIVLVKDFMEMAASVIGFVYSAGVATPGAILQFSMSLASCTEDVASLLDAIYPTYEKKEAYKQYYIDKYGIRIRTLDPSEIGSTFATMKGSVETTKKLKYESSFHLFCFSEDLDIDFPAGSESEPAVYVSNLIPNTDYGYWLFIEFSKQGFNFRVTSGDGLNFRTLKPSGKILFVDGISQTSAVVNCQFSNAETIECGIVVQNNAGYSQIVSAESIESPQALKVSGLQPNTEYSCIPFVRYTHPYGVYYETGPEESFTTTPDIVPLPDLSGTWYFEQSYYSQSCLTLELVLETQSSTMATYSAKPGFFGGEYLGVSVERDGTGYIGCYNTNGNRGFFHGVFNESYTVLSGDGFDFEVSSGQSWWANQPWSLHR